MTPPKPRKVKLVGRRDQCTGNYIQIPCSDGVNLDKADDISELTEKVLSETSMILEKSRSIPIELDLYELGSETRDVSVDIESVVHACEIVTVRTDVETGNNEIIFEVNTSIDEVILLLNNKNTDYTGEK